MRELWQRIAFKAQKHRASFSAACAGVTAFINIYALQCLLPALSKFYEADSHSVSLAVSATTLAVAGTAPFAGWLVGRMTRGQAIKLSVGGLVLCGFQVALANDLSHLIFWRFCQGLFLPILVSAVLAFLAQDFQASQLSKATSNYITWTIVGGFLGRWIAGYACAHSDVKTALFTLACLNGLVGLLLVCTLKDSDSRLRSKRLPQWRDLLKSFGQASLRSTYAIGFLTLFTMVGAFSYATFHLAAAPYGLSTGELGNIFCVYLLSIAITPFVGTYLPSWGMKRTLGRTATTAIVGLLLTLTPKLEIVVLGLALLGVGCFATQAAASSHIAKLSPQVKSLAAGTYLSLYYLGGSLGAIIPGFFWASGGWVACIGLLVACQACLFFFSRDLS